jgi:hypothetical protein
LWCFWAPPAEKRPKKRDEKNRREKTTGKSFFCGVFEIPLLRNAQKRQKKTFKNSTKKQKVPWYPI